MSERPEILALIPARGGSRSVPRKNIIEINGRPLIAYSIEQALASSQITRTIVTTDDEEIAEIARECGAETPFLRPAEISGDRSLDIEAFVHALNWLQENEGYETEVLVHLRPTGPVRRVEVIDAAIGKLLATPEADSLRTVVLAEQTPYKMWHLDSDFLRPVVTLPGVSEAHSVARQSLPKAYWQNGYVDLIRPRTILEKSSMVGDCVLGFLIEEPTYDIDYPEDVEWVAEGIRRLNQGLPLGDKKAKDRHPV